MESKNNQMLSGNGTTPATVKQCIATLEAYKKLVDRSRSKVLRYANCVEGETVFCLGNGPSLLEQDPQMFVGRNVVCTNHASTFLDGVRLAFRARMITDSNRILEVVPGVREQDWPTFVAPHVVNAECISLLDNRPEILALPTLHGIAQTDDGWEIIGRDKATCSFQLDKELEHCGKSVIFAAVQLAVFAGATSIVLVGVDMDYNGVRTHFVEGVRHLNQSFDYETHSRGAFVMFRERLAARGVRLMNATKGGRIDVLERVSLPNAAAAAKRMDGAVRSLRNVEAINWPAWNTELTEWRSRHLVSLIRQRGVGRRIFVWGENPVGRRIVSLLEESDHQIEGVIDERGGDAITPAVFFAQHPIGECSNVLVVVCSVGAKVEICARLEYFGFRSEVEFVALPY